MECFCNTFLCYGKKWCENCIHNFANMFANISDQGKMYYLMFAIKKIFIYNSSLYI